MWIFGCLLFHRIRSDADLTCCFPFLHSFDRDVIPTGSPSARRGCKSRATAQKQHGSFSSGLSMAVAGPGRIHLRRILDNRPLLSTRATFQELTMSNSSSSAVMYGFSGSFERKFQWSTPPSADVLLRADGCAEDSADGVRRRRR